MKDRRVRAVLVIGVLLLLWGRSSSEGLLYRRDCKEMSGLEYIYEGCWWWL